MGLTIGGRWASANAKTFFEGLGLGGERETLFLGGGWASRGECDMFVYLWLAPGASATCSFVWGAFVFGGECEISRYLGARLQGLVQHISLVGPSSWALFAGARGEFSVSFVLSS